MLVAISPFITEFAKTHDQGCRVVESLHSTDLSSNDTDICVSAGRESPDESVTDLGVGGLALSRLGCGICGAHAHIVTERAAALMAATSQSTRPS